VDLNSVVVVVVIGVSVVLFFVLQGKQRHELVVLLFVELFGLFRMK
jgi:hypothetical protein